MAAELSSAALAFSLDLYKQLLAAVSRTSKNTVVAPFSIATALSMTLAGARGRTADEIAAVLHTGKLNDVHTNFSEFLAKLSGLAPNVTLEVANRLYCEKTFNILEEYSAALKKFYGTTVAPVNFKAEAEQARLAVNAWVEEATKSKIKDLLPSGTVDYDTALVLVNAVYFKGLWEEPFKTKRTSRKVFHLSNDISTTVDMMRNEGMYRTGKCDDLKASAIEIPYKGGKTSMLVILPDEVEGLADIEAALTPSKLTNVLKCLGDADTVILSLPRFKVQQAANLKETLSIMGVKELFSETADLSGINGAQELSVSAAIHKAFVEVNEEGTEAAAATAMPAANSCEEFTLKFTVNRPFMFLIRCHDPDIVLFLGSVREI